MTRLLLCAGPARLVVEKDGVLFFRRPDQPDTRVPYSPENYPVFLCSARHKYDLAAVVGPHGEQEPALPEGAELPALYLEQLPSGETVYRLLEVVPDQDGVQTAEGPPKLGRAAATNPMQPRSQPNAPAM